MKKKTFWMNVRIFFFAQESFKNFINFPVSVNPHGNDCPPALKLVACVVLLEATAFLRESYPLLPKSSRLSHKEKAPPWDKVYREANRRWSMALSSMGHSQTSAQSLQSIAGAEGLILIFIIYFLQEFLNLIALN